MDKTTGRTNPCVVSVLPAFFSFFIIYLIKHCSQQHIPESFVFPPKKLSTGKINDTLILFPHIPGYEAAWFLFLHYNRLWHKCQ